jgi:hypothetical protein
MDGQIIDQTMINSVTCLLNQLSDHLSKSDMLYYYIDEITTVNAVFCVAGNGDGDHQNDGYDSDPLSNTVTNNKSCIRILVLVESA